MKKYYPAGAVIDDINAYGYAVATLLIHVLNQAGDDLTRANIMKQAANVKNIQLPMVHGRHQGQHQRDRFLPDPIGEAGALQG